MIFNPGEVYAAVLLGGAMVAVSGRHYLACDETPAWVLSGAALEARLFDLPTGWYHRLTA
jgi:hypothetical protein